MASKEFQVDINVTNLGHIEALADAVDRVKAAAAGANDDGMFRLTYGLELRARAAGEPDTRSVDVVASTPAVDSYNEIVVQDWKLDRYKANPVVLYGHDAMCLPIGKAENVRVEDGKLLATLVFVDAAANPMAEQVWQCIKQGALRAVSVGFKPGEVRAQPVGDQTVFVLSGNELAEISVVPMGANPEALAVSRAKALATHLRTHVVQSHTENPMRNALKALGLPDTANDDDAVKVVNAIREVNDRAKAFETELLEATGAGAVSEIHGVVKAWKVAHEELPKAQARIKELEDKATADERNALIAQGVSEKKLTPATKAWAEGQPVDALKAFLAAAPAIPALAAKVDPPTETVDLQGKRWEDLKPIQKAQLHAENPALYEALKEDHQRRTTAG